MTIQFLTSTKMISPENLVGFFQGWPNPPSPETHLRLLQGSDEIVVARERSSGRVIGFITAITDGVMSAFIPHLEAVPDFQGRGIGTELTRLLLLKLGTCYSIDLSCDPELVPFYERLGMRGHSGALIRNFENQNGEATLDTGR
ncbi:MAG: GNAT family N-acetyltransferase [Chloroflexi bacterium]|nr:GNAT family N-acetyltransferase [Chloroflexota bacterium]